MSLVPALANDIYITQVGDTLDLDIVQDGQDNQIGDSTTGVTLTGDNMIFDITQTGSYNDIAAIINGTNYTGTWIFTGDYNTVDLLCDSLGAAGSGNCEDVALDITTTGDTNDFKVYIGENADSANLKAAFTITGDGNEFDVDVDGTYADITVIVNNSATLDTTAAATTNATAEAGGNAIEIDVLGDGDANGHTIDLTITGGGNAVEISQSGIYDNMIKADFTTNGSTINITQSD